MRRSLLIPLRPSTLASLGLGLGLGLTFALGGCKKKDKEEDPPAEAAADAAATAEAAAAASATPKPAPKAAEIPGSEILEHDAAILGHFAVANGSKLLGDIRRNLVNPEYQGFLDEAALRSLVSMSLDSRGMLAQNIDLAAPMGCAVVDFKTWETPVACTFAYTGGVKGLLSDLGKEGLQAESAGHGAHYIFDGQALYIDDLGSHVVLTPAPDLFAKTRRYLKADIVDRAGMMFGDIEVVGYASEIWELYNKDLTPLFAELEKASSAVESTGNPRFDEVLKTWANYNATSTQRSVGRFSEYAQISFYVSVADHGTSLGVTMVPTPGSEAEREGKAYGGRVLDPAFLQRLPAGAVIVGAFDVDPKSQDTASVREIRDLAVDSWATLTGNDREAALKAITEFQAESQRLYDGKGGLAVFNVDGALFGALMVQQLRPGVSARESWRAWSASFTPEAVLGREFKEYVRWEFKADAASIDGVAVDRWVIEPGPALQKEIDRAFAEEPEAKATIDELWGPIALTFDRAETENAVLYVLAPKGELEAMRRGLAAQRGQGSLASDPGLAAIMGRERGISGVFAFDVKAGIAWLRGIPGLADPMAKVPQNLGNNLSDLYLTSHYLESGVTSFEYVLSQPMINQIKGIVAQLD